MNIRSIRTTYVVLLILVILPLFGFFAAFNYLTMNQIFDDSSLIAAKQSRINLTDHIVMAEKSYELIGDEYQKRLLEASEAYKEAYDRAGGLDNLDLEKLKRVYNNLIDLYVINEKGVIVRSTHPPALGLDFAQISPSFASTLDKIRLGNKTVVSNISEDLTSGRLKKWSYTPSSDHRYILEIGINDIELEKYVTRIDYYKLASDLKNANPLLVDIKVYSSVFRELVASKEVTDPKIRQIIEKVLSTRMPYIERENETLKREYFFVRSVDSLLNDSGKVVSITYDYSDYSLFVNASFYLFLVLCGIYAIFILLVISWVTRKIITVPLNELSQRMKIFSQNREYNKLDVKKDDEIGRLIQAYNNLVDELHTTSESEQYYKEQSTRDQLTGLYNRHYMMGRYSVYCGNLRKQGKAYSFIMWDIDHFKDINDSYGHSVGDEVLKCVSAILSSMVGGDGIVVRHGGEEFLAIIHLNSRAVIGRVEKIRTIVEKEVQEKLNILVTISAGIAFYNEIAHSEDRIKLVDLADKRLYEAKEAGRNRVVYPG